jgi:hypothetical protein
MVKFEILKRTDGNFMFNLKASNGEIIMTSQGYTTKSACQNGITSSKKNGVNKHFYKHATATNGNFYFNLTAANNQVIGTSQMYTTKQGSDHGIESVMKNVHKAEVIDLSIN